MLSAHICQRSCMHIMYAVDLCLNIQILMHALAAGASATAIQISDSTVTVQSTFIEFTESIHRHYLHRTDPALSLRTRRCLVADSLSAH